MNIDAKRELDAQVAQLIMGWKVAYGPDSKYGDYVGNMALGLRDRTVMPSYSTNIGAALDVAGKMISNGFEWTADILSDGRYYSAFLRDGVDSCHCAYESEAESICKSALWTLKPELRPAEEVWTSTKTEKAE